MANLICSECDHFLRDLPLPVKEKFRSLCDNYSECQCETPLPEETPLSEQALRDWADPAVTEQRKAIRDRVVGTSVCASCKKSLDSTQTSDSYCWGCETLICEDCGVGHVEPGHKYDDHFQPPEGELM